ncbi:hypothetical protein G6F35_012159 [Rhizopus arrhizus]|nr:hypothetical protein G6F35_012159 [Rhizopus arrhizus]
MLQQDYLFEWRTILDNVMLGAEIQGRRDARSEARAVHLLEKCGLGAFLSHTPRQLSGGMRQRAALARTLVTEPDVILLDEPFSALDSQTRLAISDEVVDILRREGKTVVLVTHDIGEAIAMTDRVIVLSRRPGRLKSQYRIHYGDGARPTPFQARSRPEFNTYFKQLWDELDVHVEGAAAGGLSVRLGNPAAHAYPESAADQLPQRAVAHLHRTVEQRPAGQAHHDDAVGHAGRLYAEHGDRHRGGRRAVVVGLPVQGAGSLPGGRQRHAQDRLRTDLLPVAGVGLRRVRHGRGHRGVRHHHGGVCRLPGC